MTSLFATLVEIFQLGSEILGVLDLPKKYWPQPGQYLACQRINDHSAPLATPLFCTLGDPGQLTLAPIPAAWGPGEVLAFLPPQGHGFELPTTARRVGLIPFEVSPARLLSLVNPILAQGAEVALFCDPVFPMDVLSRIPSRVEILPLSTLAEDPTWPDYLAVDLERSAIDLFIERIDLGGSHCEGGVLVRTDMPCRGVGECGVCAVPTRRGWRFACVDGPVFPVAEVLYVA